MGIFRPDAFRQESGLVLRCSMGPHSDRKTSMCVCVLLASVQESTAAENLLTCVFSLFLFPLSSTAQPGQLTSPLTP